MKKSELRQIIREEIKKTLKENLEYDNRDIRRTDITTPNNEQISIDPFELFDNAVENHDESLYNRWREFVSQNQDAFE